MIRPFIFFFGVLLLLSSCGRYNLGDSYVGPVPDNSVENIATDATTYLAATYPPGNTSISLQAPKDFPRFSRSFENHLRQQGFVLSASGKVSIAYVLDKLRDSKTPVWYLQLRIADHTGTKTVARTYNEAGQPLAGISSDGGDDYGKSE